LASNSHELAHLAGRFTLDKRATEVVILDLRGLTSVTDFFVICSGAADIHTKAIAEHVRDSLAKEAHKPWHIEGLTYGSWILMDYVDVVVHIFLNERREYYGLERLWGDAPAERLEDE
jgi:ribosome-associated protein